MSKRLTQIDKAIENIDAEIRVLQLARDRLVKQQPRREMQPALRRPKLTTHADPTTSTEHVG
jgi:hypothetical protein